MATSKNIKPLQISDADVHNEIRRFLLHEIGIKPVSYLHNACIISDLGLDSLERISLCVHLEKKYGIRLDLGPKEDPAIKDLTHMVIAECNAKSAVVNVK